MSGVCLAYGTVFVRVFRMYFVHVGFLLLFFSSYLPRWCICGDLAHFAYYAFLLLCFDVKLGFVSVCKCILVYVCLGPCICDVLVCFGVCLVCVCPGVC